MSSGPALPQAPALVSAGCRGCWLLLAVLALVVASFWSLDLQWGQFLSLDAARSMGRFIAEFFPPDTSPAFLRKVALGTWATLALSDRKSGGAGKGVDTGGRRSGKE